MRGRIASRVLTAAALLSALAAPGPVRAADTPLAVCTATTTAFGQTCEATFQVTGVPYSRLRVEFTTQGMNGTVSATVRGSGQCLDYEGAYCYPVEVRGELVADQLVAGTNVSRRDVTAGTYTLTGLPYGNGSATFTVYDDGPPSLAICRSNAGPPPFGVNCPAQVFTVSGSTTAWLRIQVINYGNVTAFITPGGSCPGSPGNQCRISATFAAGGVVDGVTELAITLAPLPQGQQYRLYVQGTSNGYVRGEVDPR